MPGSGFGMAAWHTATAIALLGLGVLTVGRIQPPGAGGPVAVIVPPWQSGGLGFAAATGLPIIDIRWQGRLVLLDLAPGGAGRAGLGPFVLALDGPFGCAAAGAPPPGDRIEERNG